MMNNHAPLINMLMIKQYTQMLIFSIIIYKHYAKYRSQSYMSTPSPSPAIFYVFHLIHPIHPIHPIYHPQISHHHNPTSIVFPKPGKKQEDTLFFIGIIVDFYCYHC